MGFSPNAGGQHQSGQAEYQIGQPGSEPSRDDSILSHGESHALHHEENEGKANAAGDPEEEIPPAGRGGKGHCDDHHDEARPGRGQTGMELGVEPGLQVRFENRVQMLVVDDFLQCELGTLHGLGPIEVGDAQFASLRNADGSVNLVHYAAWLVKEMSAGGD